MLAELRRHGLTILVSTPYMDEAVRCDRVALCDEGGILKIDTPEGIVNDFDSVIYSVKAKSMLSLLEKARLFSGVADCYPFGEWHHMVTDDDFDVSDFLSVFGCVDGFEFIPVSPTIEDVFIKLMKR
jgi:ABC-type multidrug transport system ATPase subunit